MFRSLRVYRCAAAASTTTTTSTAPVTTTTSDSSSKTIIHGDKIGNRFAEKPKKSTPRWVLNEAAQKHKGWGVYQNRKQVIEVLQAVRVSKPEWWCSACDDVLARMINLRQTMNWGATSQERGAIIVIEGLDGVGKTTVTQALASESAIENDILASEETLGREGGENNNDDTESSSSYVPSSRNLIGSTNSFFSDSRQNDYVGQNHAESRKNFTKNQKKKTEQNQKEQTEKEHKAKEKLIQTVIPGALLMRTPDPCLDTARAKFRVMEEPVARAFYCAANYITADAVIRYTHEGRVVVLDRWWNSTCAMALASRSLALAQMTIKDEQKNLEKMMARKEARLQQLEEQSSSSSDADTNSTAAQAMKIAKSILFPPQQEKGENDSSSSTSDYFSTSSSSSKKEKAPSSIWSRYFGQESLKQKEISKMEEMEMTRDLIMNPPERLERQLMIDLLPEEKNKIYSWPSDLPPVDLRILLDVDEDIRKKRMAKRGDENQEEKVLAEKKALRDTAMEAYRRMTPELKIVQVPNWASAVNEIVDEIEKSSELRKLMPRGMPKKYSQDFVDSIKPY